jgi:hypothetical protein
MNDLFAVHTRTFKLANWSLMVFKRRENSAIEFDRTERNSSRVKGQFKSRSSSSSEKAVRVGVQEPSQPSRLVGLGRRVGPVGPRGTLK